MWPEMIKRGVDVVNLCNSPEAAEAFTRAELPEIASKITHHKMDVVWDANTWTLEYSKKYWVALAQSIRAVAEKHGEDCLVWNQWVEVGTHPDLGAWYVEKAMPFPWVAVYLSPSEFRFPQPPWVARLKSKIKGIFSRAEVRSSISRAITTRKLKAVFLYDENTIARARRAFEKGVAVDLFPDLANLEMDASFRIPKLEECLAAGAKVVCCLGGIARRKGVMDLLRAAGDIPSNWRILVAGEILWELFSADERNELAGLMENPPPNVIFHSRAMGDAEFNSVLRKCDLVYLGYKDFLHSSNIQVKSAALRKPIIAPPKELIAERTLKYGLGFVLGQFGSAEIVSILAKFDQMKAHFPFDPKKVDEFLRMHSREKFCDILNSALESA